MLSRQADILKQIDESRKAIKQKHLQLKHGLRDIQDDVAKIFKPIIQPLNQIANPPSQKKTKIHHSTPKKSKLGYIVEHSAIDKTRSPSFEDTGNEGEEENMSVIEEDQEEAAEDQEEEEAAEEVLQETEDPTATSILKRYVKLLLSNSIITDPKFGVRHINGKLMIGSEPISFDQDSLKIRDEIYPQTQGLLELLFKRRPNKDILKESDIQYYREIAKLGHLMNKKFDLNKSYIKNSNNIKYLEYLRDLNPAQIKRSHIGKGLPKFMIASSKELPIDYKYWDDPNELVDRLRLLVAERLAGNNNHENEILAIIEELRECGIIY